MSPTSPTHTRASPTRRAARRSLTDFWRCAACGLAIGEYRTAIYKLRDLMVTFTPDFEFIPGSAPEQRQVPPGRPFVLPNPVNIMGE